MSSNITASKGLQAELLLDEELPATVYITILLNEIGSQIYEIEPETLWLTVHDAFGLDLPESVKDKVQALISAVVIDTVYEDYQAFECIGKALNGEDPRFGILTPLTPEQIAWTVAEIDINDDTPQQYSSEIRVYIREILHDNGFLQSPDLIKFCELEKIYPMESFLHSQFREQILTEQEIKTKRITLYIEFMKKQIAESLSKLT